MTDAEPADTAPRTLPIVPGGRLGPRKIVVIALIVVAVLAVALTGSDPGLAITLAVLSLGLAALGYAVIDLGRVVDRQRGQINALRRKVGSKVAAPRSASPVATAARPNPLPRPMRSSVRVADVARKLWLGFGETASAELHDVVLARDTTPAQRSRAALELARWYAANDDRARAAEMVALARVVDPLGEPTFEQEVLEADWLTDVGRVDEARELLRELATRHAVGNEIPLRLANTFASPGRGERVADHEHGSDQNDGHRLALVNQVFRTHGLVAIDRRDPRAPLAIDNLVAEPEAANRVAHGPLVSVIMPAHQSAETIGHALRSLTEQTWRDLEVVVVDDASTDDTAEIATAFADLDPRVRLLRQDKRAGAYVARNRGVAAARGAFVTVHDADDWSHPQKIERQVRALLADERCSANLGAWVRVDRSLVFVEPTMRARAELIYPNVSSLMVRREVLDRVGPWDEVRVGADTEFLERVRRVDGARSVGDVDPTVPLSFGLRTSEALTVAGPTSVLSLHHALGARRQYRDAQVRWHSSPTFLDDLPLDPSVSRRPFPRPLLLATSTPTGDESWCDVVIVADFTILGGSTMSTLQEIAVQAEAGLRTGLVHVPFYTWPTGREINPKVFDVVDGEQVRFISSGETVDTTLLIVRPPRLLQHHVDLMPTIRAEHAVVVVNATPLETYPGGDVLYDLDTCRANLARYGWADATWHPIGPAVRRAVEQHHGHEVARLRWSDRDWENVIDHTWWRRETVPAGGTPPRDRPVRIGRHARDHPTKWPATPAEVLAAYPDDPRYRIDVLGGADVPEQLLGVLPGNWRVRGYDDAPPRDYLHQLDVMVYMPHPDLVEAFGRSILEALAAGVPVVAPPRFAEAFGDAVVTAEPSEVAAVVDKLVADREWADRQVALGHRLVEERFSWQTHLRRLRELGVGAARSARIP